MSVSSGFAVGVESVVGAAGASAAAVLPSGSSPASHASAALPAASPVSASPPSVDGLSPFARLLRGLAAEVERGESLTRTATGEARFRHDLEPGELLALQAGVYRYGEALDLASRLIDRATSSVKAVLQGQ